jgi:hypothetical protein
MLLHADIMQNIPINTTHNCRALACCIVKEQVDCCTKLLIHHILHQRAPVDAARHYQRIILSWAWLKQTELLLQGAQRLVTSLIPMVAGTAGYKKVLCGCRAPWTRCGDCGD